MENVDMARLNNEYIAAQEKADDEATARTERSTRQTSRLRVYLWNMPEDTWLLLPNIPRFAIVLLPGGDKDVVSD